MVCDVCRQDLFYRGRLDIDDRDGVVFLQRGVGFAAHRGNIFRLEVPRGQVMVLGRAEDTDGGVKVGGVKGGEVGRVDVAKRGCCHASGQANDRNGALRILEIGGAFGIEGIGRLTLIGYERVAAVGSQVHVIWQRAHAHAPELLTGCGVEKQRLAVVGLIRLLHRGDGQAIGAHGHRVNLLVTTGGDGADLVRVGGIGPIKDVDLAGARIDGEDALGRGVISDDFGGRFAQHTRFMRTDGAKPQRSVWRGMLQHVIHDVGMRGRGAGEDERGGNAERDAFEHRYSFLVVMSTIAYVGNAATKGQ